MIESLPQLDRREAEQLAAELLARRYADALALLDASGEPALGELQFRWVPVELFRGDILTASGDRGGAEAAYRAAASVLEAKRDSFPSDERFAGALGLAYAGLGMREEALREVRRGVQLMPVEKEFWRGIHRREELARVYARIGDDESALAELEYLLSRPGEVSAAFLRLDPEWDDLRAEPRFRALVGE